jgi:UDP-glucose 4-epimerase
MGKGDGSSDQGKPRRARRKDSPTPSPSVELVTQSSTLPAAPMAAVRSFDPERRVVAVTGARSFIGSETLKRLEEDRRYRKLIAFDLRKPDFPLDKTQFYKLDLTLPTADADMAAILEEEGVDTVVHAAFLAHPTQATAWAHELEDIGTMHVLNATAQARVRKFVLSSTTLVYGANPLNPNFLSEQHELRGLMRSRFVNDKVNAEKQVRRFRAENPGTIVTALRVAPTLGPRVHNFITRFFSRPVVPVMMGYDPLLQFIHEEDVVDAFKLAIDGDFAGEFNVVGEGVLPYSTVRAMMGKFPLPLPHFLARSISKALWATQVADTPPAMLQFFRFLCVADGRKARDIMGFEPRYDIKSTIQDFLGIDQLAEGVRA